MKEGSKRYTTRSSGMTTLTELRQRLPLREGLPNAWDSPARLSDYWDDEPAAYSDDGDWRGNQWNHCLPAWAT